MRSGEKNAERAEASLFERRLWIPLLLPKRHRFYDVLSIVMVSLFVNRASSGIRIDLHAYDLALTLKLTILFLLSIALFFLHGDLRSLLDECSAEATKGSLLERYRTKLTDRSNKFRLGWKLILISLFLTIWISLVIATGGTL
jgi:hypothetical protein